jgi:hypothetical protein
VQKIIRSLILSVLLLAGCQGSGQRATHLPAMVEGNTEAFLIESAASDFRIHVAPEGVSFRNVHVGVFRGDNGSTVNLMCGEFRTADNAADWQPFATLRTEGYENWLGSAAAAYCRGSNTTLDTKRDLATELGARYHP